MGPAPPAEGSNSGRSSARSWLTLPKERNHCYRPSAFPSGGQRFEPDHRRDAETMDTGSGSQADPAGIGCASPPCDVPAPPAPAAAARHPSPATCIVTVRWVPIEYNDLAARMSTTSVAGRPRPAPQILTAGPAGHSLARLHCIGRGRITRPVRRHGRTQRSGLSVHVMRALRLRESSPSIG